MLNYLLSSVIFFPIVLFTITFFICKKLKKSRVKCFGHAADVTTFVLFFSVSLSISSLWNMSLSIIVFVIALIIAIIFTYLEWRTKKEIEVPSLLKKIWRVLFIYLTISYIVVWVIGLVQSIIEYVTS